MQMLQQSESSTLCTHTHTPPFFLRSHQQSGRMNRRKLVWEGEQKEEWAEWLVYIRGDSLSFSPGIFNFLSIFQMLLEILCPGEKQNSASGKERALRKCNKCEIRFVFVQKHLKQHFKNGAELWVWKPVTVN